MHLRLFMQ